jgi:RNA polymerase sigma-70 factor (ECF subfamily)
LRAGPTAGASAQPDAAADGNGSIDALLLPLLPRAYAYARRLTRDDVEAEDLLQDAAARACEFFHQFRTGTNFRAWFFKILTNCFYGRIRKERHRTHVSLDQLDDAPPVYLYSRTRESGWHDLDADPAEAFVGRLDADVILHALDDLPEEYRAVATLYFLEDLPYDEIAGVLGIPVGTVRSRLHRGRRVLQRRLWDVASDRGLVPPTPGPR